ncbi:hypothetical protein Btru_068706 [Bulinus truncatus]|nr:hypothetical protein Btru_068706 [Bulinus truncatus]
MTKVSTGHHCDLHDHLKSLLDIIVTYMTKVSTGHHCDLHDHSKSLLDIIVTAEVSTGLDYTEVNMVSVLAPPADPRGPASYGWTTFVYRPGYRMLQKALVTVGTVMATTPGGRSGCRWGGLTGEGRDELHQLDFGNSRRAYLYLNNGYIVNGYNGFTLCGTTATYCIHRLDCGYNWLHIGYNGYIVDTTPEYCIHRLHYYWVQRCYIVGGYNGYILGTTPVLWIQRLNTVYTCYIVGTTATYWIQRLNCGYNGYIVDTTATGDTTATYCIHRLHCGYNGYIVDTTATLWIQRLHTVYTGYDCSNNRQSDVGKANGYIVDNGYIAGTTATL